METTKLNMILVLMALVLAMTVAIGCGDDDDDDDDDSGDDDDSTGDDDDSTGDDDADHPCDDLYDVVIDGATDLGQAGLSEWTANLVIAENGNITGNIAPEDAEMDPYNITGFRHDQTSGELDGSFATPADMEAMCEQDLIYAHIDFTVVEGTMEGDVTFYCGSVDQANLIGVYEAEGEVTCGDFAA
jgi:hypothetical protein